MRLRQLVDWQLVLAADHVHSALRDLADEHWTSALPQLLEDFQQLLRDALDLLRELGEADDRSDRSHWDLPSITPHWQNRGFRDWVSLIELLRDAWLAVRSIDKARATRIAQTWFELPYPTFKRLTLFAASQEACIAPEQWVNWLLADGAWWLWSTDTGRESTSHLESGVNSLNGSQSRSPNGDPSTRTRGATSAAPASFTVCTRYAIWHGMVYGQPADGARHCRPGAKKAWCCGPSDTPRRWCRPCLTPTCRRLLTV